MYDTHPGDTTQDVSLGSKGMSRDELEAGLHAYKNTIQNLPDQGIGKYVKIQSALLIVNTLAQIQADQNLNPFPVLLKRLEHQLPFLKAVAKLDTELGRVRRNPPAQPGADVEATITLYERAWTTYGEDTYEHSVQLIRTRLEKNGFDKTFFADKRCFDGGCGTGRFAVAMAELGAGQVVAADLGEESLKFARHMFDQYGLTNIELVVQDVTDLGRWADDTFDFVVSNGVLHHTSEPENGIKEHFRITKPRGTFWLYLYGAGGIFWHVYDQLRDSLGAISVAEAKSILGTFGLREGLIYTFLDNVFAPRRYFYTSDVVALLQEVGDFTVTNLKGSSEIDDTEILLSTQFGQVIYGPQGEVRIRIDKAG